MNTLQKFVSNGEAIHYTHSGSGQPLIFIPGSISDYRTWVSISKHFEQRYSCYVLSRRFQYPGAYRKGGDSSVAANTEDIASFIREKGLAPVHLIAHSFGGFIALNLALRYPELERLIPNAKRVTIERAGHWVHIDEPEAFVNGINQFFKESVLVKMV